ncbi:GNAT family N-acetyltransferase [Xanthobacter sp. 91]|uniref:GNAT family N-acetyltransferase n=1 Tax=Xanthobacter sp. 91 TaxID=1117244 RepID=UPI0018CC48B6|nr:GNAT family N-acetyltransferase [Xanthobacter sp. 91]
MALLIADAQPQDEAAWRRLWAGYNAFYETEVGADITARTWARILDPEVPIIGRIARRGSAPVGFSISILHEGTWVANPVCYLEDLFVDPACRGGGIGRALIADLVRMGKERGWSSLYWHTRQDNPARRLYDSFVAADDFVRYRMDL